VKRRHAWVVLWGAAATLAGCAAPRPAPTDAATADNWAGRLSLQVDSDPPQNISADFELSGTPQSGDLRLSTLLGQTLATARWTPDSAVLQHPNGSQVYPSLDTLMQALTGTPLPLHPLFDWLRGTPTPAEGWTPDLSRHAQGRLVARRTQPLPSATLRLVFQ